MKDFCILCLARVYILSFTVQLPNSGDSAAGRNGCFLRNLSDDNKIIIRGDADVIK